MGPIHTEQVGRGWLLLAVLGGPMAWLAHLLGAYLIAEFGCMAGWGQVRFLTWTAVTWAILGLSLIAIAGAGVSLALACCLQRKVNPIADQWRDDRAPDLFLAWLGVWHGWLFLAVILVQCLPVFFYLRRC